ncbi:hypothetical protein [Streptomyces sp. NPDC001750]|uniref:hypothetical protein n=1 Tax=Streptomyces sp. NPDC001750 TaxID=3364607 RepID=UPI00368413E5
MSSKKMDALVARLRAQGAVVTRRGSRWHVTQPGRPLVFLPTSDPVGRGLGNKLADLKRKGYGV